jgi:hypothetical protein
VATSGHGHFEDSRIGKYVEAIHSEADILTVSGFELRASAYLAGSRLPPALPALVTLEIGSCFFAQTCLDLDLLDVFAIARMTGAHHQAQLNFFSPLRWVLNTFCPAGLKS